LRQEVKGIVSDRTLMRFCETSPAMIEWLIENGAEFRGTVCPFKTSYPTDPHYLYYSGNEKAWPYNEHAEPAPRGHRQVAKGLNSGKELMKRLMATALRKGVVFKPLSRVHELITENGAVTGVRYKTVARPDLVEKHRKLTQKGGKLGNWFPSAGKRFSDQADALWAANAVEEEARSTGGVILSAGGFVYNPEMKAKYAGGYKDISPLGTVGDDGGGIMLGVSAGGVTNYMSHMTGWRFISPPPALSEGVAVGPRGTRIINEDLYGATFTHEMVTNHEARGYLILDSRQWKKAKGQLKTHTQIFQKLQAMYLFAIGNKKAGSLEQLARIIGVPADAMMETIRAYNDGIKSGAGDPYHKAPDMSSPIEQGPFYAIDISVKNSPFFPTPGLTLGGLIVDEDTGFVLKENGDTVQGLYAAGRTAVGICSNGYISGLSLADGVFSGRRAGGHAALQAKA
jgi:3-oxo-5alpha-steroid 4-dehydrogenase